MRSLARRDRLSILGYALWGALLYAVSSAGLWRLFAILCDRKPGVLDAAIATENWMEGAWGVPFRLTVGIVLGSVGLLFWATGYAWSALSVLRAGPREGRIPASHVLLLSFVLAGISTMGFVFQEDLPGKGIDWRDAVGGVLASAWCLTWALDTVRRKAALRG